MKTNGDVFNSNTLLCSDKSNYLVPYVLLPPANEVWGKVIFLHLSVILFTGGPAWLWGAMRGCGGASVVAGGMCGWGACMVPEGCIVAGVCMVAGGCAWLGGMCG